MPEIDPTVAALTMQLNLERGLADNVIDDISKKFINLEGTVSGSLKKSVGSITSMGSSSLNIFKDVNKVFGLFGKETKTLQTANESKPISLVEKDLKTFKNINKEAQILCDAVTTKNKGHLEQNKLLQNDVDLLKQVNDNLEQANKVIDDEIEAVKNLRAAFDGLRQVGLSILRTIIDSDKATQNFVTTNFRLYDTQTGLVATSRQLALSTGVASEKAYEVVQALGNLSMPKEQMVELGDSILKANQYLGVGITQLAEFSRQNRFAGGDAKSFNRIMGYGADAMRKYGLSSEDVAGVLNDTSVSVVDLEISFGKLAGRTRDSNGNLVTSMEVYKQSQLVFKGFAKSIGADADEMAASLKVALDPQKMALFDSFARRLGISLKTPEDRLTAMPMLVAGMAKNMNLTLEDLEKSKGTGQEAMVAKARMQALARQTGLTEKQIDAQLRLNAEIDRAAKAGKLNKNDLKSVEDFMKIKQAEQATNDFKESMGTLTGQIGMLKTRINAFFGLLNGVLGKGLYDIFQSVSFVLKPITAIVEKIGNQIRKFGESNNITARMVRMFVAGVVLAGVALLSMVTIVASAAIAVLGLRKAMGDVSIAQHIATVRTGLYNAAMLVRNAITIASSAIMGIFTGSISLSAIAMSALNAAIAVGSALLSPYVLVVVAVVAALTALYYKFDSVSDAAQYLYDKLKEFGRFLVRQGQEIWNQIKTLIEWVKNLTFVKYIIDKVIPAIKIFVSNIKVLDVAVAALAISLGILFGPIGWLILAAAAVYKLYERFESVRNVVDLVWAKIKVVGKYMVIAFEAVRDAVYVVYDGIMAMVEYLTPAFQAACRVVDALWTAFKTLAKVIMIALTVVIVPVYLIVKRMIIGFMEIAKVIFYLANIAFKAFVVVLTKVYDWMSWIVTELVSPFVEGLGLIYDWLMSFETVQWVINGISDAFDRVYRAISSFFSDVSKLSFADIVNFWWSSIEYIEDNFVQWMTDFPGKLADGFYKIGSFVVLGFIEGVKATAIGLYKLFKYVIIDSILLPIGRMLGLASPSKVMADIGMNMIYGLIDGVKSVINGLADIGQWIWDNTAGRIISMFGIASPSTKMMELGGNIISGLYEGFMNNPVTKLIAGAAKTIAGWFGLGGETELDVNKISGDMGVLTATNVPVEFGEKYRKLMTDISEGSKIMVAAVADIAGAAEAVVTSKSVLTALDGFLNAFDLNVMLQQSLILSAIGDALKSAGESIVAGFAAFASLGSVDSNIIGQISQVLAEGSTSLADSANLIIDPIDRITASVERLNTAIFDLSSNSFKSIVAGFMAPKLGAVGEPIKNVKTTTRTEGGVTDAQNSGDKGVMAAMLDALTELKKDNRLIGDKMISIMDEQLTEIRNRQNVSTSYNAWVS